MAKVLPLTLKEFDAKYGTSNIGYKTYISSNHHKHHYGKHLHMFDWLDRELGLLLNT